MSVALLRAELGASIEVFGRGRDGGREATHTGRLAWNKTADDHNSWDGYTVFQAKFHVSAGRNTHEDATWLKSQIDKELEAWRGNRTPTPNNLVFITNARLSSVPGYGIDDINEHVKQQLGLADSSHPAPSLHDQGLHHFHILHRDTIIAQLNSNSSVRYAFSLHTESDLVSLIGAMIPSTNAEHMRNVLVNHGEASLKADRLSRFSVAGSQSEVLLSDWIIDLPCTDSTRTTFGVIKKILRHAGLTHKPSLCETKAHHIVLTGAPGNGKSTIASFLTQYLRAEFLSGEKLSDIAEAVRTNTVAAAARIGAKAPVLSRWPITIPLPELAEETYGSEDSFFRWLAKRITRRADTTLDGAFARRLVTNFATLFVFDGLEPPPSFGPDVL